MGVGVLCCTSPNKPRGACVSVGGEASGVAKRPSVARSDTRSDMSQQGDEASGQKREIAGFYSRVAATYDAVGPAVFSRRGERVVALAGIDAGARAFDVAAGRGAKLFPRSELVGPTCQGVGIDPL